MNKRSNCRLKDIILTYKLENFNPVIIINSIKYSYFQLNLGEMRGNNYLSFDPENYNYFESKVS